MPDIDLNRLPTGARGWAELVAWASASDDRLERYFLELKSDVDLTVKHGRHKVAKFILGAANRDPAKAARRFGGHAVLLLGVGGGAATGIAPFEAQDLEREVRKFAGADGPGWDYEQIPIDADHSVVAIVVDPPTGKMWPCLSDGEGMSNGDIYLRGDGRTEKATGAEIQTMLRRAGTATSVLPDIAVEIIGEALAVRLDRARLVGWIEETAQDYLDDVNAPAPAVALPFAGLRLRVANPVKTSLRDVRIDIEFDGPVKALDWEDRDEDTSFELFPDRPTEWGRDRFIPLIGTEATRSWLPVGRDHGILRITQASPAHLSLSLNLLRAEETFTSDEDEVVLVLYVDVETDQPITGRWRLTAGDVHDVLDGTVSIPVDYRDWSAAIAQLIGDDAPAN